MQCKVAKFNEKNQTAGVQLNKHVFQGLPNSYEFYSCSCKIITATSLTAPLDDGKLAQVKSMARPGATTVALVIDRNTSTESFGCSRWTSPLPWIVMGAGVEREEGTILKPTHCHISSGKC